MSQEVEQRYVKKAFLLVFGNMYAIPTKELPEDSRAVISYVLDTFKALFNASPLVKSVKTVRLMGEQGLFTGRDEEKGTVDTIELLHPLKLRISLPIKNQEISNIDSGFYGKEADLTSKFGVVYDGRIYVIFREVDLSKRLFCGGAPDIREALFDMFSQGNLFGIKHSAPNPLHESIYLVYLEDSPNVDDYVGKFYRSHHRLYFYLREKQLKGFENLVGRFLHRNSGILCDYYSRVSEHRTLEKITVNLRKIHGSIQALIEKSLKASFWNIFKHYGYSKELEKLVSRHYSTLLDYSGDLAAFRENGRKVRKKLDDSLFLKHFTDRFLEAIEFHEIDVDVLTKCVSFAKEIVQRSYTSKVTLLGASIGIIGALVGTVVLHLLGF